MHEDYKYYYEVVMPDKLINQYRHWRNIPKEYLGFKIYRVTSVGCERKRIVIEESVSLCMEHGSPLHIAIKEHRKVFKKLRKNGVPVYEQVIKLEDSLRWETVVTLSNGYITQIERLSK